MNFSNSCLFIIIFKFVSLIFEIISWSTHPILKILSLIIVKHGFCVLFYFILEWIIQCILGYTNMNKNFCVYLNK